MTSLSVNTFVPDLLAAFTLGEGIVPAQSSIHPVAVETLLNVKRFGSDAPPALIPAVICC